MTRTASQDPLDKFRFQLTLLGNNQFFNNTSVNVTSLSSINLMSAGFSDITIPRANVAEMLYRENVDGAFFRKSPGLVKYDPVILKRGVISTRTPDFYNWYKLVNNDAGSLNAIAQSLTAFGAVPYQSATFRKEVLITVFDRAGNMVKHWMLFNAFPMSYKGGDDLDATSETKLVEELVLTYESFLEAEGSSIIKALESIQSQIAQSAEYAAASAATGSAAGVLSQLF